MYTKFKNLQPRQKRMLLSLLYHLIAAIGIIALRIALIGFWYFVGVVAFLVWTCYVMQVRPRLENYYWGYRIEISR